MSGWLRPPAGPPGLPRSVTVWDEELGRFRTFYEPALARRPRPPARREGVLLRLLRLVGVGKRNGC